MNTAAYRIDFNDTLIFLMFFLLAYYLSKPIITQLIKIIKEERLNKKIEEAKEVKENINV